MIRVRSNTSLQQAKKDVKTPATPPSPKRARLETPSKGKAEAGEQSKGIRVERWFAQISTHIVGVSHYKGQVKKDCEIAFEGKKIVNAERIQVGWLPKEISTLLLPLIASTDESVQVEGVVPSGADNKFKVPLDIQVYGQLAAEEKIVQVLDAISECNPRYGGLHVIRAPTGGVQVQDLEQLREIKDKKLNLAHLLGAKKKPPIDWLSIFQSSIPYADMEEASPPKGFCGDLFEHQRKALHWMVQREQPMSVEVALAKGLPCLWLREGTDGAIQYRNKITNVVCSEPSMLPRGGILADEMGLGKTFTAAALLLSEHHGRTLIVCPLSVLSVWSAHLKLFTPSLTINIFHGKKMETEPLMRCDVTLTTSKTFELHSAVLRCCEWHRVVLDEAHEIRNSNTQLFKACSQISAPVRWCLTGTPVVNGLKDLYSFIAFLRVEPFHQKTWWMRMIERPAKAANAQGIKRLRHILESVLLRRTKQLKVKDPSGVERSIVELPEKQAFVQRIPLSEDERALYNTCHDLTMKIIDKQGIDESLVQNPLVLLLQLRQLCCACDLLPEAVLRSLRARNLGELQRALSGLSAAQQSRVAREVAEAQGATCSICLEPLLSESISTTRCFHLFHTSCVRSWLERNRTCPLCNAEARKEDLLEISDADLEEGLDPSKLDIPVPPSSKLTWAAEFLQQRSEKEHKIVVFSQFVQVLKRLASLLVLPKKQSYVLLTGEMSATTRAENIEAFQTDESVRVILCSTRCAGVGVTLSRGDTVVLLDPWWNKSIEEQAIDRVHRMGQKNKVEVFRLVAQDTVEERILALQEAKGNIADAALSAPLSDAHNLRSDIALQVLRGPWNQTKRKRRTS